MSAPAPTERTLRMMSRDRADHPGADEARCQIKRPHEAHPYGREHAEGGLSHWCGGRT